MGSDAQAVLTTLTATSDQFGNATFRLNIPALSSRVQSLRFTVAVPDAGPGARFLCQPDGGGSPRVGPWFGPQPYGPVTIAGNTNQVVLGSGLRVNTMFTMEILGVADDLAELISTAPSPTGTTALVGNDEIVQLATFTVLANQNPVIPASGLFPASGYASLRLAAQNMTATLPATIDLLWKDASQAFVLGQRSFLLGPGTATQEGNNLQTAVPHLGDFFGIRVSAPASGPVTVAIYAEHTTQEFQGYGGLDTWGGSSIPVGAAPAAIVAISPIYLFGGPAVFTFNAGTLTAWTGIVQVMDTLGNWLNFFAFITADGPRLRTELVIPARPMRVIILNGGAAAAFDMWLTYDLSRVG